MNKCVHRLETKGHGKDWCVLNNREADCDNCKVGAVTRSTPTCTSRTCKTRFDDKAETLYQRVAGRHHIGGPVFTAVHETVVPKATTGRDGFLVDGGFPSGKYNVTFTEQASGAKREKDGLDRTITSCLIFANGGLDKVGHGLTMLGYKDKPDTSVARKIALGRALKNANFGKGLRTRFWKQFLKYNTRQKVVVTSTPRNKNDMLRMIYGGVPAESAYGRSLEFGRRKQMQRWVACRWNLPNELNKKLQELVAEADFTGIERRLLERTGVTWVYDEYIIDTKKWVSPVKLNEVVTFQGQVHQVVKIAGPCLTLQPLVGDTVAAFDWEIEKRDGPISKFFRWWKNRKK